MAAPAAHHVVVVGAGFGGLEAARGLSDARRALVLGGGLAALQTASITAGLPFALVLLIMIYSLYKGMTEELFHLEAYEITDVIKRTPIDVEKHALARAQRPAPHTACSTLSRRRLPRQSLRAARCALRTVAAQGSE